MKEQQEIIQKICGIAGHKGVMMHPIFSYTPICMCKFYDTDLGFTDKYKDLYMIVLLGFLKSKEVLVSVWGEDCWLCSTYPKKSIAHLEHEKDTCWQHAHNEMGYTVEECLEYYGRFLG